LRRNGGAQHESASPVRKPVVARLAARIGLKKIIHLIPFDAPGGVETAALSAPHIRGATFDFQVRVLFPGELTPNLWRRSLNPAAYLVWVRRLVVAAPDVLIVSLWRAAIIGVVCKRLCPSIQLVVFLHNTKFAHRVDAWATRMAVTRATEIWSDSRATIDATFPQFSQLRSRIVSYIPCAFEPVADPRPAPVFVFWGRLARQKNLQRAIRLFAAVLERLPAARFAIVGPDGGEGDALRRLCRTLSLQNAVSFLGPKSQHELPGVAQAASFFLFTSEFEGMGLAVVEAMQMGLVPVVTKVGEVGVYCRDGVNAIVIDRDELAVAAIIAAIEAPEAFARLRANAIATWSGKRTYRDDVLGNCARLLDGGVSENTLSERRPRS